MISAVTTAVLLALAGCAGIPAPFACPAIGYSSVASIRLSEPATGLQLELCSGSDCTPGPVEMPVQIGSTATPLPTGILRLDGNSETGWTATLLDAPTQMGFRLSDGDGTTVREGAVDVEWTRVDGTEQCGGNQEADIVIAL